MSYQEKEFNIRAELHISEVIQGDTFNFVLAVNDESGTAVDYSTRSEMVLTVYEEDTEIKVIEAKKTENEIDLSTPGEIAFDIAPTKMDIPARVYDYKIVFTDTNSNKSTEFGGKFEIVKGQNI